MRETLINLGKHWLFETHTNGKHDFAETLGPRIDICLYLENLWLNLWNTADGLASPGTHLQISAFTWDGWCLDADICLGRRIFMTIMAIITNIINDITFTLGGLPVIVVHCVGDIVRSSSFPWPSYTLLWIFYYYLNPQQQIVCLEV